MNPWKPSPTDHQPHPQLGLTPRMVIPLAPSGGGAPPLEVCYLDYALVKLLRVTNTASAPLSVMGLVVNDEFEPGAAWMDGFQRFRYPIPLFPGASFEPILQPPSTANLPFDCSYLKLPVSLVVSTETGHFTFHVSKPLPDSTPAPGVPRPLR